MLRGKTEKDFECHPRCSLAFARAVRRLISHHLAPAPPRMCSANSFGFAPGSILRSLQRRGAVGRGSPGRTCGHDLSERHRRSVCSARWKASRSGHHRASSNRCLARRTDAGRSERAGTGSSILGRFAPRGTPVPVVRRLHAEISDIAQSVSFNAAKRNAGVTVAPGGPEILSWRLRTDRDAMRKLASETGLKLEP